MSFLLDLVIFILTLWFLILAHEFGHFLLARLLKVRVQTFSIGFGRALVKRRCAGGTEYRLGWIPLGGYVELYHSAADDLDPSAFNHAPKWRRLLIILAGVAMNLLIAWLLFALSYVIGFQALRPVIEKVSSGSVAAQAHLPTPSEIVSIDDKPVATWRDAILHLLMHLGEKKNLKLELNHQQQIDAYVLNLANWHIDALKPNLWYSLGITPFRPDPGTTIQRIIPDSPAARAGLKAGDVITEVNGVAIQHWHQLLSAIHQSQGELKLSVIRDGQNLAFALKPEWRYRGLQRLPTIGVAPANVIWPERMLLMQKYPLPTALGKAYQQTSQLLKFNAIVFYKLLTGQVSLRSLSGPVGIFQSSAEALNAGFIHFTQFVAFISLMLAFVNILPIPGLDGSQLLYVVFEWLTGKPISAAWQMMLFRLGFIALLVILAQASVNDFMRLL